MHRIFFALFFLLTLCKLSFAEEYLDLLFKAREGDLRSQRLVASALAGDVQLDKGPGGGVNKVLSCAWWLVIVNSSEARVNAQDKTKANQHCGKLDQDVMETSKEYARQWLNEIEQKKKNLRTR